MDGLNLSGKISSISIVLMSGFLATVHRIVGLNGTLSTREEFAKVPLIRTQPAKLRNS